MALILISTLPVRGHVIPARSVASKLTKAGHKIVFALPKKAIPWLELEFECQEMPGEFKYSPTTFRPLSPLNSRNRIAHNMAYVLCHWTISQLDAIYKLADRKPPDRPDIVISDCLHLAPLIVARKLDIRSAVLGVTPYRCLLGGSAPVRSGWKPANNFARTKAYDAINGTINWLFRRTRDQLVRRLTPAIDPLDIQSMFHKMSIFNVCKDMGDAFLQCSTPDLEDRPTLLERNGVQFIGPMNSGELAKHIENANTRNHSLTSKRTIFITWGTMQGGPPKDFIHVAKELQQCSGIEVIVSTSESELQTVKSILPADTKVISGDQAYFSALSMADVFVSNGGFGGVKAALTLGIPVVCFGSQDDKPDVCGRVDRSRAGIGFLWQPKPEKVVDSILRVLNEPSFKTRAVEISQRLVEYEYKPPERLVQAIEKLLENRRI
jgi:UDP:flavonoid glycosyltransferase YjiC (YdhE family)